MQERIWNCIQCSQQVTSILFSLQQFPCSLLCCRPFSKGWSKTEIMGSICNLLPVRCSNRLQQVEPWAWKATCSWEESSFILQSLTHVKYERLIFLSRRYVQAGYESHFQEPSPESTQHLGEIRKAPISLPIFHPCLWRSCCGPEALEWQVFSCQC